MFEMIHCIYRCIQVTLHKQSIQETQDALFFMEILRQHGSAWEDNKIELLRYITKRTVLPHLCWFMWMESTSLGILGMKATELKGWPVVIW